MPDVRQALLDILREKSQPLAEAWLAAVDAATNGRGLRGTPAEAMAVLDAMRQALATDPRAGFDSPAWSGVREALDGLSTSSAARGHTAGETSRFVLALKGPLFTHLQQRTGAGADALLEMVMAVSQDVDAMAQWTVDKFQRAREDIIARQQDELLELSTPVIKLWDGILAVPMIGTLDSTRTQLVMEALLQRIVETESTLAIIDITGVPTVDTLVAQHLLKTVAAIRLLGADCIISGIRPQIAQTVVHLGIDLQGVSSKSTLAGALALALKRAGYVVTRQSPKD